MLKMPLASGRGRPARADRRSRPTDVPSARDAGGRRRRPKQPATSSASSGATSSRAAACPASRRAAGARAAGRDRRSCERSENKVVKTAAVALTTARSTSRVVAPGTYHAGDRRADVREALRRVRLARHQAHHAVADHRLHLDLGRLRDGGDRAPACRRCRETCSRRREPTARASGRCSGASPCRCSRPSSSVVFITMIINVLKVFDLVITLAPGSSQNARRT